MLERLSVIELNRFQKFVDSPYFNADQRLSALSEFFIQKIKSETPEQLQREALFHLIWPQEPFAYARINQLLTELKRLLDRFLAIEYVQQKDFRLDFALLQTANERGWDKLYRQAFRQSEKHLISDFQRPEELAYFQYELARSADYFALSRKDREHTPSLEQALFHLQAFSLLASLKHVCELLNRQHILPSEPQNEKLENLIQQIEERSSRFLQDPYVLLYYELMCMLREEKHAHFEQLCTLLRQNKTAFSFIVRKELNQYARNFCIRKINQGETAYYAELLTLYEEALQDDLLWEESFISAGEFKNIVSLSLRLRRYSWAKSFMESYSDRIRPAQREAVLAYNEAHLMYAEGALQQAIRSLRSQHFEDVYYELGARTLLLKIYFELEEETGFWALVHAFGNFLRRHKQISAYQKEVHLNFIKLIKKLERLRQGQSRMRKAAFHTAYDKLAAELQEARVNHRDWLEGQLEKM